MNALIRYVALTFVGTVLWAACGGDSSGGDDPVSICKQGCDKYISLCFADAGDLATQIKASCDKSCSSSSDGGGATTCTNASAQTAAYKACLEKTTCSDLTSCIEKIPPCEGGGTGGAGGSGATGGSGGSGATGGTGATGGSGGTGGGTGGTGGTGGGTDGGGGGTCADLLACCNAATNEQIKMACLMGYNAIMGQGDAACGMVLTQLKPSVCP